MTNSLPKSKDQFEYWLGALPFYNNVKAEWIYVIINIIYRNGKYQYG